MVGIFNRFSELAMLIQSPKKKPERRRKSSWNPQPWMRKSKSLISVFLLCKYHTISIFNISSLFDFCFFFCFCFCWKFSYYNVFSISVNGDHAPALDLVVVNFFYAFFEFLILFFFKFNFSDLLRFFGCSKLYIFPWFSG